MSRRNALKIQRFGVFVKKKLKMNMSNIQNIMKLGMIVIIEGNVEVLSIVYAI